jgi:hypothetical protein
MEWKVLRGYRGYEEVSNQGHCFSRCGTPSGSVGAMNEKSRTSGAKALFVLVWGGTAKAVPFMEGSFPSEHGARDA